MSERATLGRDDFAAISAFRYALGRMTYIVGDTVDWLIESWPLLSEHARTIIARDLKEEIERDDLARAEGWDWKPLGWDFDREYWLRLRDHISVPLEAPVRRKGKKMQRELRYIVLKNIDVQRALTNCEYAILIELCKKIKEHRLDRGAGPLCCVVVEHDWPEYEPTWAAIEARVDAEIAANRKAAGFDA